MFVVKKTKGETSSLPAQELELSRLKPLTSKLAQKVLKCLAAKPTYAMDIAKQLKVHEQKVYYHIRKLEKAGIISILRTETIGGATASIYKIAEPAFYIKFKEFENTQRIVELDAQTKSFLSPFIESGKLNASIIVGSPDPHGPEKARSRDGYYGIDFALFLGTFLNYIPSLNVKLDTEVRTEDLQNNLILLGGPVVNTVTGKINNKLPIRFAKEQNWNIYSSISDKSYTTDETGIIAKIKNPFNPKKYILLIAGKRHAGTRAVMIACLQHFKEIIEGNKLNPKIQAKVIEGIDLDADGIVDEAEVLE